MTAAIPTCLVGASNLTDTGETTIDWGRRTARRIATLTSGSFCWSTPIPFGFWDGTDPAMRGPRPALSTPANPHAGWTGVRS